MGISRGMNAVTKAELCSPLKERPLRLPGQSIDRQIDDVLVGEVLYFCFLIGLAITWPIYEWVRWFVRTPLSPPWLVTIVALLTIVYASLRLLRSKKRLDALKLGRDGERVVAEKLDEVRDTDGSARIFHDILASGFNVDHVILSQHGIYVIETKTLSKHSGTKAEVLFDGTTLRVDGRALDRDPIAQVTAEADWIKGTLKKLTTKEYPVKPVLVFPGRWVNPIREHRGARVWVLNPEALPAFIKNERVSISDQELQLAVFSLARYIHNSPDPA